MRPVPDSGRSPTRQALAHDASRAGARAHFRAMGIDPSRLDGPIVGIASTWTGTMPCNLNQLELAARVADGVTAAGGVPLGFNTIAVSDNQSQATPGMRASLISREVIADSIELMVHAHDFDALVCVVGCDKTVPAALMALAGCSDIEVTTVQDPKTDFGALFTWSWFEPLNNEAPDPDLSELARERVGLEQTVDLRSLKKRAP